MSITERTQDRASNTNCGNKPVNGLRAAFAVLAKDIRCELRTRHSLTAALLFSITSTIAVSFTLGAWGANSSVASALLWIVIYFSAMSTLSRSFVHEEETYTASLLRLTIPPNSVYLGKLGYNLLTIIVVEVVAVPLYITLMNCRVGNYGLLIGLLLLGSLGLSAGATVAAAMVSKAVNKGSLFAVISFPLLIPVLAVAIHGSDIAMSANSIASALVDIRLLAYYCGAVITASLMLFRFIWED